MNTGVFGGYVRASGQNLATRLKGHRREKIDKSSGSTSTTVITQTKTLTAEEERILRMRAGASLSGDDVLESKLDDVNDDVKNEVSARLALMQAEIMNAMANEGDVDNERRSRIVASSKHWQVKSE